MRVLHILKIKGLAGAENHLLALAAGQKARGVDVRFLLLVEPDNPVDAFVTRCAALDIPAERLVIRRHLDPLLLPRVWRAIRRAAPDLVHTHMLHGDLYGIPAARAAGVRAVVTSRHNDDQFRLRPALRGVNRALWALSSAGIAISEAVRRFSIEVEGVPPEKVHTVYYGYEPQARATQAHDRDAVRRELGIASETVLIGTVCRLIEQKGLPYGIEAFARVAPAHPQAHLLLVGDGVLRAQLEEQVAALGLGARVTFAGWRADAPRVMAAFDVFLMPSLWEGFGLVLLEAMAQRLPVVGSAVSAIPEVVINGDTGLLVAPRDVDGLAAALDALLRDPARRAALGARGYERLCTEFSPARMVERTLAVYESVMKR